MSTKLNDKQIAARRRFGLTLWTNEMEHAYAAAIREVAQPIADERDELMALLIESQTFIGGDWRERRDAALSKYPKTEQR